MDICALTAPGEPNVLQVAKDAGVAIPDLILRLFADGCDPKYIAANTAWPAINSLTTARAPRCARPRRSTGRAHAGRPRCGVPRPDDLPVGVAVTDLPAHGRSRDDVLADLDAMRARDVDWRSGRAFTLAYHAGDEVLEPAGRCLRALHGRQRAQPRRLPEQPAAAGRRRLDGRRAARCAARRGRLPDDRWHREPADGREGGARARAQRARHRRTRDGAADRPRTRRSRRARTTSA